MRRAKALLVTVLATAIPCGAWVAAALADSDAPPSEVERTSNTGTIVFIGLCAALVVLVSYFVLLSIPRKRSSERDHRARPGASGSGTPPRADVEDTEDSC